MLIHTEVFTINVYLLYKESLYLIKLILVGNPNPKISDVKREIKSRVPELPDNVMPIVVNRSTGYELHDNDLVKENLSPNGLGNYNFDYTNHLREKYIKYKNKYLDLKKNIV